MKQRKYNFDDHGMGVLLAGALFCVGFFVVYKLFAFIEGLL